MNGKFPCQTTNPLAAIHYIMLHYIAFCC